MSDHNERACTRCGSLTHHEDDCPESAPQPPAAAVGEELSPDDHFADDDLFGCAPFRAWLDAIWPEPKTRVQRANWKHKMDMAWQGWCAREKAPRTNPKPTLAEQVRLLRAHIDQNKITPCPDQGRIAAIPPAVRSNEEVAREAAHQYANTVAPLGSDAGDWARIVGLLTPIILRALQSAQPVKEGTGDGWHKAAKERARERALPWVVEGTDKVGPMGSTQLIQMLYSHEIAAQAHILPAPSSAKTEGQTRIDRTNVIRNAVIKWDLEDDPEYTLDQVCADIIAMIDAYTAQKLADLTAHRDEIEALERIPIFARVELLPMAPHPIAATDVDLVSLDQALAFCHLLRDRTDQISEEQFHECLHRAIRCDRSYSNNVFIHFKNNPAAFLAHRTPQTQSIELLKFIFSMPEK